MSIKNTIITFICIVLFITLILSNNQAISTISVLLLALLILPIRLIRYISRRNLIKKVEEENIKYFKVKDNNKLAIIPMTIIIMYNLYSIIKDRYDIFKDKGSFSFSDILPFINSLDPNEKILLSIVISIIVFLIITIVQAIINTSIVTEDKVIFWDSVVFDIDKIEEIEYKNSLIKKNKKKIQISKGFSDRVIIIDMKDFDNVKRLLECKNI